MQNNNLRSKQEQSLESTESERISFAHQAEEIFTRILDFYGIEWQYEPRTFPLEWDKDGNVIEAFTPDFYLPQQNLYIELTTLKAKLARYKNRRLRLMKELYPEIHIKLFKRREMREMLVKYGLYDEASQFKTDSTQNQTRVGKENLHAEG